MNGTPWWIPLLSVVIGVILGYAATELRESCRRTRERRGHLEALAVEIQICSEIATGYLVGKVRAPAYRMPVLAYQRSLPAILAEGVLNMTETNALVRFYANALAFNFSIDQAQAVLMKKQEDRPPNRLELEVRRARLKAEKLGKSDRTPNHYDAAMSVLKKHLPEDSQRRLTLTAGELVEDEAHD